MANSTTDTTALDDSNRETVIDDEAQWIHTRHAVEAMGRALEPLSPEMRARVLCASAILAGVDARVVEMLSR